MVDPFNLLDMRAVPVTLAIDEYGIIRAVHPMLEHAEDFERLFVEADFAQPDDYAPPSTAQAPDLDALHAAAQSAADWSHYAAMLTLWGDAARLNEAIDAGERALSEIDDARTHFNLGVAYRMRHDSTLRQTNDFRQAVEHWIAALNHDPNNYIWRRRLQQYGPRLDKPYSFYDWVNAAREAINARGETPVPLKVEPGGAEFAYPTQDFGAAGSATSEPDPEGQIYRDEAGFITSDVVIVPPEVTPGDSVRVHITLRPHEKAHWNNEVDETLLWVNLPQGWEAQEQHLTAPKPDTPETTEPRHFEFELRVSADAEAGQATLDAYSLYYICEDVNGMCLYRRQDIAVQLTINAPDGRRLRDGG